MTYHIRRLATDHRAQSEIAGLSQILIDCVANGASVGFMHPLSMDEALAFWRGVVNDAKTGARHVFIAEENENLIGTAQWLPAAMPNQPHRADIAKVLVPSYARRRGIGAALMQVCEADALAHSRWLLTLDTVTSSAGEALYSALGWQRTGAIPNYALMPDGSLCDTMIMWKQMKA